MFDHIAKTIAEKSPTAASDTELELLTTALEAWSPIDGAIVLEQQLAAERDMAEALAASIKKHGATESLVDFVDHDKSMSEAFGVTSLSEVPQDTLVTAFESIAAAEKLEEKADKGENFRAVYWIETSIAFMVALKALVNRGPAIDGYRMRMRRYRDSVANMTWDEDAAKDAHVRACPMPALREEVKIAGGALGLLNALWAKDLPTTREEYRAWVTGVGSALKAFGPVYGIYVEEKGWFSKTPKVVFKAVDPKFKIRADTLAALGYGKNSMDELHKLGEEVINSLTRYDTIIENRRRSLERAQQDIKNGNEGIIKRFVRNWHARAASDMSRKIGGAVLRRGVIGHTLPAITQAMGQVRRGFVKRSAS